jgi:hypothetical protein
MKELIETKWCPCCKDTKPIAAFVLTTGSIRSYCSDCSKIKRREYYSLNRKKENERNAQAKGKYIRKDWASSQPEYVKAYNEQYRAKKSFRVKVSRTGVNYFSGGTIEDVEYAIQTCNRVLSKTSKSLNSYQADLAALLEKAKYDAANQTTYYDPYFIPHFNLDFSEFEVATTPTITFTVEEIEAALIAYKRQKGLNKPAGKPNGQGIWHAVAEEIAECCKSHHPTESEPDRWLRHCKTATHVATMLHKNVDHVKALMQTNLPQLALLRSLNEFLADYAESENLSTSQIETLIAEPTVECLDKLLSKIA